MFSETFINGCLAYYYLRLVSTVFNALLVSACSSAGAPVGGSSAQDQLSETSGEGEEAALFTAVFIFC